MNNNENVRLEKLVQILEETNDYNKVELTEKEYSSIEQQVLETYNIDDVETIINKSLESDMNFKYNDEKCEWELKLVDDEMINEINKQGKVVIEIENYDGSTLTVYGVDLENKSFTDKEMYNAKDNDLYTDKEVDEFENHPLKTIDTNNVKDLINEITSQGYELADCDGDYFFDTEYTLIRFQQSKDII